LRDGEADIREVLALTLTDAGDTIATARDGRLVLETWTSSAPPIIITDTRMPRVDGLQVLEHAKKR
jgi:CheY-like chemotaxis protein